MEKIKRRKKFIGTPLQKKIMFIIFFSAVVPTALTVLALYYLIFNLLALQIGIPEAIAYNIIPVLKKINLILLVGLPLVFALIWIVALELSHRIVGPLFRLERELDERISGKRHTTIRLRQKDELQSLAEKLNKLLER